MASTSPSASRASSVAWPARSVARTSTSPSSAATRATSSSVTRDANGLTIRTARAMRAAWHGPFRSLVGVLGAVRCGRVAHDGAVVLDRAERVDPPVAEALVVPRQADVHHRRLQAELDVGRRQFDVASLELAELAD